MKVLEKLMPDFVNLEAEKEMENNFELVWNAEIALLESINSDELESYESAIKHLEDRYDKSETKKQSLATGDYPDEYAVKLSEMKEEFKTNLEKNFNEIHYVLNQLLEKSNQTDNIKEKKEIFEELFSQYNFLSAFVNRWKSYGEDEYGVNLFESALEEADFKIKSGKDQVNKTIENNQKQEEYTNKLEIAGKMADKADQVYKEYTKKFLNIDGKNKYWNTSGCVVGFVDHHTGPSVLERLKRIPSKKDIKNVDLLFSKMVHFMIKNKIVEMENIDILKDYSKFLDFCSNFSLFSNDPNERYKAHILDQMRKLYLVMRDSNSRKDFKKHTETYYSKSFVSFTAPIHDIYMIFQRGIISSQLSQQNISSNMHALNFTIDSEIKDGDMGFIFPLTKLLENNHFTEVANNESSSKIMVFNKKGSHLPISADIRNAIFVAPKNRIVTYYDAQGNPITETCYEYFVKFFQALANSGSHWFEGAKLNNWLSRHCIFYEDGQCDEVINLLFKNKHFTDIINRFTNKKYDNLALVQSKGEIKSTSRTVALSHQDPNNPNIMNNFSLFEWKSK